MGKAGKSILAGALEALSMARGEKMPTKVTRWGYMVWRPAVGLVGLIHDDKETAELWKGKHRRSKVMRVMITAFNPGETP